MIMPFDYIILPQVKFDSVLTEDMGNCCFDLKHHTIKQTQDKIGGNLHLIRETTVLLAQYMCKYGHALFCSKEVFPGYFLLHIAYVELTMLSIFDL